MKVTFKDGIIIEISDYSNEKEAIKKAKEIHKEFIEDKKFKDSFRVKDSASVVKRHIYDSYEDASEFIEYLEKLLDRKNIYYSGIYLDEQSDSICLEFTNQIDTQSAFEVILEEDAAKKEDIDLDKILGLITIKLK